jgi:hypothetical protein
MTQTLYAHMNERKKKEKKVLLETPYQKKIKDICHAARKKNHC